MAYFDEGENSLISEIGTKSIPENGGLMRYGEKRKEEYPDITEQLDDLFKAGAFSTEMTARIQAVKDRYAKETEETFQARVNEYQDYYARLERGEVEPVIPDPEPETPRD